MKRLLVLSLLAFMSLTLVQAQKSKFRTAKFNAGDGKYEKALKNIKLGLAGDAEQATSPYALDVTGLVYLGLYANRDKYDSTVTAGALDKAFKAYKDCIKYDAKENYVDDIIRPQPGSPMFNIYIAYKAEATKAIQAEDYEGTYSSITKAIEAYDVMRDKYTRTKIPKDFPTMLYKSKIATILEKHDEALALLEEIDHADWNDTLVLADIARIYTLKGSYEKALMYMDQVLELQPNNSNHYIGVVNIYILQGVPEKALDKFQKAIELDPENIQLRLALGGVYERLADSADSEDAKNEFTGLANGCFMSILEIDSMNYQSNFRIGVSHYNLGADYEKQLSNLPPGSKGVKALEVKRDAEFKAAIPYLEKAHSAEPNDVDVMKALKKAYYLLDNMAKVKEISSKIKAVQG